MRMENETFSPLTQNTEVIISLKLFRTRYIDIFNLSNKYTVG